MSMTILTPAGVSNANTAVDSVSMPVTNSYVAATALTDLTVNTLAKWDATSSKMVVAGASDKPSHLYIAGTQWADGDTNYGMFVALGAGGIISMVASGTITIGDLVVVAANGKVQALPNSAGNYYQIGQAITGATADGQSIAVNSCVPIAVTIS